MNRIIAVNSNSYHGFSIEDALYGIHDAGFHYVELTATKGWTEHIFPSKSFEYLTDLKKLMEELDIIPFAVSGHCNLMDKNRLPDFIKNIELANFFSSKYIVSSIGEAHIEDEQISNNESVVVNIKTLIPHLEKYRITLVLEIHGDHSTGTVLKDIVNGVDHELVMINYDTGNAIFYGNVQPEEDIDVCMNEIGYMHIKDKLGKNNDWNFPAIGKGGIDFPKIFSKLDVRENNCPLSIEIEFTEHGPENLQEIHKAIQDSAKYLKNNGFVL